MGRIGVRTRTRVRLVLVMDIVIKRELRPRVHTILKVPFMHASECIVQIFLDSAVIFCERFLHSETLCLCPQSVPAAAVWWEHS